MDEWNGNYGPMKTYRLRLNDGQEVDLNQKPETAPPSEGQEIYGDLTPGKYRPKLKKAQRPDGASSSSGSADYSRRSQGNGKGNWEPESQRDPEKTARIGRAHAQGVAVQALGLLLGAKTETVRASSDDVKKAIAEWTDWFQQDVDRAAVKATVKDAFPTAEEAGDTPDALTEDDGVPF